LNKELVIQSSQDGTVDIALLEDRQLLELHHEKVEDGFLVGDIYLGRIKKVIPGLNAAFVDIGHEKDAFLHYLDLGPDVRSFLKFGDLVRKNKLRDTRLENFRFEPEIVKTGKIDEVFTLNSSVIVQIVKEPISTKGPRLTSQISIPGRFIILIPFSDTLSLSKKIANKDERSRLKKIIAGIKPKNFGLIVRTNAQEASTEELEQDLKKLMGDWDGLVKELAAGNQKLYSEADKTVTILRDILNASFTRITVDSQNLYQQMRKYLHNIGSEQEEIIKLYKGDKPVFEALEIDKQLKSLFNKIVNLGGGAYLVIEHTEAMHVIDVNSGSKRTRNDDQEDNALKTNLEAASEIARQLRLRDMGGIIVVDFIDMRSSSHRKLVFERMRDIMAEDRAKHTILPLSKFGVLQITRQRVRPEINMENSEPCPVCNGTGVVSKHITINEEIERKLEETLNQRKAGQVVLKVHPFLHAYFTNGFPSPRMWWFIKYRKWVKIEPVATQLLNEFEIS
jgi:ribonuclease G